MVNIAFSFCWHLCEIFVTSHYRFLFRRSWLAMVLEQTESDSLLFWLMQDKAGRNSVSAEVEQRAIAAGRWLECTRFPQQWSTGVRNTHCGTNLSKYNFCTCHLLNWVTQGKYLTTLCLSLCIFTISALIVSISKGCVDVKWVNRYRAHQWMLYIASIQHAIVIITITLLYEESTDILYRIFCLLAPWDFCGLGWSCLDRIRHLLILLASGFFRLPRGGSSELNIKDGEKIVIYPTKKCYPLFQPRRD